MDRLQSIVATIFFVTRNCTPGTGKAVFNVNSMKSSHLRKNRIDIAFTGTLDS